MSSSVHRQPLPERAARLPDPSLTHPDLPRRAADLTAWIVAILRTTHPVRAATALRRAEATALEHFAPGSVLCAVQEAIAIELYGDTDVAGTEFVSDRPRGERADSPSPAAPGPRLSPPTAAGSSRRRSGRH